MSDCAQFLDYWGKAGEEGAEFHRLAYHCLDVAAVGSVLSGVRPRWLRAFARQARVDEATVAKALVFLLALHDLGKFGAGFQRLRPDLLEAFLRPVPNVANRPRHDTLGHALWQELSSPSPGVDVGPFLLDIVGPEALSVRRRRELLLPWAAAVFGHHGRPPEVSAGSLLDHFGIGRPVGSWVDARDYVLAVRALLAPSPLSLTAGTDEATEGFKLSSWWLSGFAILCDWIGSNPAWFPFESSRLSLEAYWQRAQEQAERAVREAGLEPRRARSFGGFTALFPRDGAPLVPSPLQRAAETTPFAEGPQLFLLEDLTGSGKTEAALTLVARLLAAGRGDGLFFALPTMATANAMHPRVGAALPRLFESEPAVSYLLAHSGPRLAGSVQDGLGALESASVEPKGEETASSAARSWLADGRKKALLADVGVGTIDQALVGILRVKHNTLRLLGLHGHVLVVDEVHACDEYMNGLLEELLRVQASLGGSAVLLSATLPVGARARLARAFRSGLGCQETELTSEAYPAFVHVTSEKATVEEVAVADRSRREVGVAFLHSQSATVEWCAGHAEAGRCVAWIRNTVREALEAYDQLVARLGPERVQLFHARFPLGDRLAVEQDIVQRFGVKGTAADRCGRVVVATQVMEQSLDIDFDEMVSDLAPIDRLIQRCGRMHRHDRGPRPAPVLHVLAPEWQAKPEASWPGPEFRGTQRVYQRPSVLWRTQRILQDEGRLLLPDRARLLVEAVFGEVGADSVPSALVDGSAELAADGAQVQQQAMASYNRIALSTGYVRVGAQWADDERAPTRLGEPTVILRLVRSEGGRLLPWSSEAGVPRSVQWRLGEVSVRAFQVLGCADEEAVRAALLAVGGEVPSHVVPVVMSRAEAEWRGQAVGARDQPVQVVFQQGRGVSFVQNKGG